MMLGMIFVWPILLVLFLGMPLALGLGGYVLYRKAEQAGGLMPAAREATGTGYTRACPSCGRFLQQEWINCPYCGAEISQATR
ncbi:MAG: hypothetical protein GTO63_19975 [Anaerolineae bacterium]|nr:hypothetical protein [Anaerolineae bacterium]NIN97058.1 hypothetical protein [Anaerolineae bacterium]NIQ80007.1 hypothetical protein [Anaerolineae bacterium]